MSKETKNKYFKWSVNLLAPVNYAALFFGPWLAIQTIGSISKHVPFQEYALAWVILFATIILHSLEWTISGKKETTETWTRRVR